MTGSAPRSTDQYLRQLREELASRFSWFGMPDDLVFVGVLLTVLMHLARGVGGRSVRCGDGCDGAAERLV
jgi:hypothetical protein